jgi:hypothetical protein
MAVSQLLIASLRSEPFCYSPSPFHRIPGAVVHKFPQNLEASPKFYVTQVCHEAESALRPHNIWHHCTKFGSQWDLATGTCAPQPGTWTHSTKCHFDHWKLHPSNTAVHNTCSITCTYSTSENCDLLGYYAESLTPENWTDGLTRNVGQKSPLLAVLWPRRARFYSTSRWKSEILVLLVKDTVASSLLHYCATWKCRAKNWYMKERDRISSFGSFIHGF